MNIYDKEFQDSMVDVEIINNSDLPNPSYASSWDAGCDVYANITSNKLTSYGHVEYTTDSKGITLFPGSRVLIPSGIRVSIPNGYEIQVRPRSGLALKQGITVLNTPGTIDSKYKNEIGVILINQGGKIVTINHGDRIAQLVLNKVEAINWVPVNKFSDQADRGGGFGHSGQ